MNGALSNNKQHTANVVRAWSKAYELNFAFFIGMGFYHVETSLYLGGGYLDGEFFSNFSKLLPNREVTQLQKMLTPGSGFAMTLWKPSALFTVGGYSNGFR